MYNNLNKKRKTWLPIHKENWFGDWFDPHESYLRLPSFWWPFTIIMIGVALVSWKVIHDQELIWGLDSRVEQWYEWFKIPLWVLALLIPVLGLFNANHKSEQTKASMGLTQKSIDAAGDQNRFANYYKHVDEFIKYMSSQKLDVERDDPVIDFRRLHFALYPRAKEGFQGLTIDAKILYEITKILKDFFEAIQLFSASKGSQYVEFSDAYRYFVEDYQIALGESVELAPLEWREVPQNDGKIVNVPHSYVDIYPRICAAIKIVIKLVRFEPQVVSFDFFENLLIDTTKIEGNLNGGKVYGDYINSIDAEGAERAREIALHWVEILNDILERRCQT